MNFGRIIKTSAFLGLCGVSPAMAQDAEFGCKVLLCAAATNPSWGGIPYCVPVINDLFSRLARGDGWPTCSSASSRPLSYQPYLACPAGSSSFTDSSGGQQGIAPNYVPDPNGSVCISAIAMQNSSDQCISSQGQGGCTHPTPVTTQRPANPKPYSITITPTNSQPFTFYFALSD